MKRAFAILPSNLEQIKMKKQRIGVVVSNKALKTITVLVQTRYAHEQYGKYVTKTKKYMAHDEESMSSIGDVVLLEESRPLSRRKNWVLKKILRSVS